MRASQEKKKRQSEPAPLETRKAPAAKKISGSWIAGGIGVLVLVILAIFFAILNSGILHQHTTALTVGSHKVSPVMYNYFYQDYYYSLQQDSMMSMVIDFNSPLDEQYYDEENGITWADYLEDLTNTQIAQVYALCDAANEAGYTLSSEQQLSATNKVSYMQLAAMTNNLSESSYLAQYYGAGSSLESFQEYSNMLALASAYSTAHAESLEYTADEIHAYFDEHEDSLVSYTYRSYTCSVKSDETDEDGNAVIDSAASEEMAKAMAEEAKGDEAVFAELARENAGDSTTAYEDDDATLTYGMTKSSLSDSYADWLTDASRVYGDTTAVENSNGTWTVVMYLDNTSSYTGDVVNIRHILVQPDDTEAEATSEEAKEKAQELLDEYLAGDQTEEAFADLAEANSLDSTALEGGLVENVYPASSDLGDRALNDWCFDPDRKPGDTGIVLASDGYHVMYFVGAGDGGNATDYRTVLSMRSDDNTAWVTELGEQMNATTNSLGMKLTKAG